MSTAVEPEAERRGLSAGEADFLGQILTANANWSASIHNAALDGQERASNEWAQRYLNLSTALEHVLDTVQWQERDTMLFDRLARISDRQGFYPGLATDQIERYRERLESEKREKDL